MKATDPLGVGLLRAVLDDLPFGVRVARAPSGEIVYSNRAPVDLEDSGLEALQDRHGRPYPRDQLPFARAVRERQCVIVDGLVLARPGAPRRHLRAVAQPLFEADGGIGHVVVVFTDITAQVRAEQEGEAARSRLLLALQHAPIVLFATDRAGVVTLSEGAGLRALGVRPGELVGHSVFDTFRDAPDVMNNMRRALGGESFNTITQHGNNTLESWLGPLRDDCGEVHGVIGISTDITERQRLQQQVAHADRVSALGRLAACVAHEINNPLSYTLEALRLCEERAAALQLTLAAGSGEPAPLAELRHLLQDAAEGAERVRLITRDLTEFARADSGPLRPVALDAAGLAASKLVAKRSAAKGRVQLDLASGAAVRADEHRLVQVFVNLILNAADAIPPGAPDRHRIRVSTRANGSAAWIEVADSGPGLSPAARAHLFQPFFSEKPVGEGTGLGLYVTHNIVTGLGGHIEAMTAPEGGALFRVSLPVASADVPAYPASQPSEAEPRPVPRDATARRSVPSFVTVAGARKPRVMVIDDEAVLTQVFRLALQEECEVDVFDNGRSGLDHLLSGARYDLVFCDLMMRDLSGMELYEALASQAPGREDELVFMTGGTFDPEVSAFVARVPNPCITKPFDIRREVRRRLAEL